MKLLAAVAVGLVLLVNAAQASWQSLGYEDEGACIQALGYVVECSPEGVDGWSPPVEEPPPPPADEGELFFATTYFDGVPYEGVNEWVVGDVSDAEYALACCSPAGHDHHEMSVDVVNIFRVRQATFHMNVSWSWGNGQIYDYFVHCYTTKTLAGSLLEDHGCEGVEHGAADAWYHWRGDPHGGHYSFRQADWENCAIQVRCQHWKPYAQIHVTANGALLARVNK